MSEEKGFKHSISFTQSVSSGIIAFHGTYNFDDGTDYDARKFLQILAVTESIFRDDGYRVATDIKPREVVKKDEKE